MGIARRRRPLRNLSAWLGAPILAPPRALPPAIRPSPILAGLIVLHYMLVKNQKLHEQFDAAASSSSHSGSNSVNSIFCGVSIFVDGYTVPSSQELRGYMLKHGGRFENYFSRHRVTHIICSNLPDSKIKNLRAFSGGLPVVKPIWVLDSVAANKLLSWIPYQLDQLATDSDNQPKLSAFFTSKNSGASGIANPVLHGHVLSEDDNRSLNRAADSSSSEGYASSEQADKCSNKVISEEPACSVESSCEGKGVELNESSPSDGRNSGLKNDFGTCQAFDSLCSNSRDNHNFSEASSSRTSLPPKQRHSTFADPNFVENYFKSSRLHFIGTWRNRYRKRFPSLSNEFRHKRYSLNTSAVNQKTSIIHIDMDCFFVSVVIRNHPELLDKPVAVCHSDNPRGTAEISSANYPARDHGVKAGMFVKDAKIRCPQLVIVPYDFGAYEKVADQFYDILHKHCNKVQAVSCDEAFLDVSESEVEDPKLLASVIRKEILENTGCTASAGIAGNMLMARLATKTAKPDGQCYIPTEEYLLKRVLSLALRYFQELVDGYLRTLPVKALPGIGHVLEEKLKKRQIKTCGDLRSITKESLQKDFGMKTGEMLWNYSRGVDHRLVGVIQESKSIGAEVNWGVRFTNPNDTRHFLTDLCKEVALRLQGCGVQGRSFTLKIKKRRSDAGEPVKYMGCGDCENLSHTITIPMATDDVDVLQRLAIQLFGYFHIDVKDIRGVGLQVSKLEGADDIKLGHKRNSILSWLVSTKVRDQNQTNGLSSHGVADTWRPSDGEVQGQPCSNITGSSVQTGGGLSSSEGGSPHTATLPPLQDLDVAVLECLPPEVVSEINDMYGGKLLGYISENKGKTVETNTICRAPPKSGEGVAVEEIESCPVHLVESNTDTKFIKFKSVFSPLEGMQSGEEAPPIPIPSVSATFSPNNLMPSSLSQVDCSVLQQLPDELKKDIIELLPQHREPEFVNGGSSNLIGNETEIAAYEVNELWTGSPPKWVDKFKVSSCGILNNFATMYQSRPGGCLSFVLQRMISEIHLSIEVDTDGLDDAVNWLCEIIKQYVDLKIASDIEEIYFCICLLRRYIQVYSGDMRRNHRRYIPRDDPYVAVGRQWAGSTQFDRRDSRFCEAEGRFLEYCNDLRSGFVAKLNKKMRNGYSKTFFVELVGKNVDQLWRDYKAKYGN
ncbi:hypothetical protein BUALT_Bualt19G0105800 [Buddleja alternifolia]|uniref:DNA repair protein REV1 n=1 Tax=Buddleja alternifolia TaxID=168488 RepID=A0AAV6W743_9LAMI|nr:hypothetical protein BUALT_Bualt19G0105800 [Buddleja alternifolia]